MFCKLIEDIIFLVLKICDVLLDVVFLVELFENILLRDYKRIKDFIKEVVIYLLRSDNE